MGLLPYRTTPRKCPWMAAWDGWRPPGLPMRSAAFGGAPAMETYESSGPLAVSFALSPVKLMLPSPYGPDRSLLLASVLLVSGGLWASGVIYLLSTIGPIIPRPADSTQAQGLRLPLSPPSTLHRLRDRFRTRPSHTRWSPSSKRPLQRSGTRPAHALNRRSPPPLSTPSFSAPQSPLAVGAATPPDRPRRRNARSPVSSAPGRGAPSQDRVGWTAPLRPLNRRPRSLRRALVTAPPRSSKERSPAAPKASSAPDSTPARPDLRRRPPQMPIDGGLRWLTAADTADPDLRPQTPSDSGTGPNGGP